MAFTDRQTDTFTFRLLSDVTGLPCSAAKLGVKHFLQNDEAWANKKKQYSQTLDTCFQLTHRPNETVTCGKHLKQTFDNNCISPGSKTINLPNFTV
jgi:hypothetical protein